MNKNPYSEILEIMKNQGTYYNPPIPALGVVISPRPNLRIKYNEITVEQSQIWISDRLKAGYTRKYNLDGILDSIHIDVSDSEESIELGPTSPHPHAHTIIMVEGSGDYEAHGSITWTDELKENDVVLMQQIGTVEKAEFIIICRLVRP